MKTFKDLKFNPHPAGNGVEATMNFSNNYGVSVIKYRGSYGYHQDLWEVVILYKNIITYNTYITSDILGHQTKQDVTDVMRKVQELKD